MMGGVYAGNEPPGLKAQSRAADLKISNTTFALRIIFGQRIKGQAA
jgi:hypothetical protein